jgi:protein-S-isoprenylcysteine O-methyltransferase Ste14
MSRDARRLAAALGSAIFFCLAPGTVAGLVPYLLTRWQAEPVPTAVRFVGVVLITMGLASLVESFARFVVKGSGTPAPVAPPTELVVSGQYRLVRNPMYVAIVSMVAGQALVLGRAALAMYAAGLWLLFHLWVLIYEEPHLRRRFGASYERYCSRVHRWLPRVRPWRDA